MIAFILYLTSTAFLLALLEIFVFVPLIIRFLPKLYLAYMLSSLQEDTQRVAKAINNIAKKEPEYLIRKNISYTHISYE